MLHSDMTLTAIFCASIEHRRCNRVGNVYYTWQSAKTDSERNKRGYI